MPRNLLPQRDPTTHTGRVGSVYLQMVVALVSFKLHEKET